MTHKSAWRLALSAACLFVLAGLAAPGMAAAQDGLADAASTSAKPIMFDARVVGDDNRVRFIADLSAKVDIAVSTLADPYRIIIDLPDIRFALPELTGTTGRGLASAFRYGSISVGKTRIVIDVTQAVAIDKSFVVEPTDGQPARLVVDVVPTTREKFLETARAYRQSHETVVADKGDRALIGGDAGKPLIVLDPGHGGIDYGARGEGSTMEKDVVLAFARVLGAKLLATERYRVAFTRRDDTFVALGERVAIARRQNARLFISIHANSFPGSAIRGASVYTVSEEATDKAAADFAAAENQSDALAGVDIAGEDSDIVKDILVDLTRRETRNFGVVFAQNLIKQLGRSTRMSKIPHQQASFKVLEAPDVPSALIELGYLTNASDQKQLVSPEWQAASADSVVEAIDVYFGKETRGTELAQP